MLSHLQVLGWEPNERGKAGARQVDISQALNPSTLITQATELNLRLMKWRLWPTLDLPRVHNTRILLLGAGTLGCAVGRILLGYGIQHVTFIDNGIVHYSNPVRQCLYRVDDCNQHQVRGKAEIAAMRLQEIYPDIHSAGVKLSIPMPGHSMHSSSSDGGAMLRDAPALDKLDELVQSHDVIFLLTDSREARWLPTVIGRVYDKLVINAALGFDSYLVMHHGLPRRGESAQTRTGCYFCNDIVSAGNSKRSQVR
jgi:ubiquitin-like modifier-activating enzyme ATG7